MSWRDDIPMIYGPPIDRSPFKPVEPTQPNTETNINLTFNNVDSVFFNMILKLSEKIELTKEVMDIISEARNKLLK